VLASAERQRSSWDLVAAQAGALAGVSKLRHILKSAMLTNAELALRGSLLAILVT
jgi:hypothetical protein